MNELVSAASGPKNQVQAKINNYNQLSTLYTTLNTKISAIDTALQAIDTSSEFREFTGTTTDEDVFTVSTDGDAIAGSYEITVASLAKAQIHTVDIDGAFEGMSKNMNTIFQIKKKEKETNQEKSIR